jgi:hypothetical protein
LNASGIEGRAGRRVGGVGSFGGERRGPKAEVHGDGGGGKMMLVEVLNSSQGRKRRAQVRLAPKCG